MKCEKCGIELVNSLFAEEFESPYLTSCSKCNQKLFITTMDDDVEPVYFELTLGKCEGEYPYVEPFLTWMEAYPKPEDADVSMVKFIKEYWVYLHHLCIIAHLVDQQWMDFCVTADKRWVQQKCPCLLTTHTQFLVQPNESGEYIGSLGTKFLEYCPDNWGVFFTDGTRFFDARLGNKDLVERQLLL